MISSSISWRTICKRRLPACSVSGGTGAFAVWFLKYLSTSERRIFLPLTVASAWSPSPLLRQPQTPARTHSTSNTVMAEADERVNRERNLKTKSSSRLEKANYISYLRLTQPARPSLVKRSLLGWSGGVCRPRRRLLLGRHRSSRLRRLWRRLDPGCRQCVVDHCAQRLFRRRALHAFAVDEQRRC